MYFLTVSVLQQVRLGGWDYFGHLLKPEHLISLWSAALTSRRCSSCWFLSIHSWLCSREGDSPHAWCIFDACDGKPLLSRGSAAAWEGLTFVTKTRAKMEVQFSGDAQTYASFWSGLGALHLKGRLPEAALCEFFAPGTWKLYFFFFLFFFSPKVGLKTFSGCLEVTNTALPYLPFFSFHLHTFPYGAASLIEAFSFNSSPLGSSGAAPCHSAIERTLLRWVIGKEPHLLRFQWSFRGLWAINQ